MQSEKATIPSQPRLLDAYGEMFGRLLGNRGGFGIYDRRLKSLLEHGRLSAELVIAWLQGLDLAASPERKATAHQTVLTGIGHVLALEMRDSTGRLLGILAVQLSETEWAALGPRARQVVATRLSPGLQILHRELAVVTKVSSRAQIMSDRTHELEWLFGLTARLNTNSGGDESIRALLNAACERMGATLGAVSIPEKRILITHVADRDDRLVALAERTSAHLLKLLQRNNRPLVINQPPPGATAAQQCRILAVPVVRRDSRVVGLLSFFNPLEGGEFTSRHSFLARHLGQQVATLLETQFDLATGLYTRAALEQQFNRTGTGAENPGSVIYLDIDRLHVVNELHGFEIGDEMIVRIADLLTPPLLSRDALAARVSGDRFAVILPNEDVDTAMTVAMALQAAASQMRFGPADQKSEVSVSCGVAALVDVPQALARALAAAELACKTAKDRGRGRVELYATADSSMMRRQGDVVAVGRLRAALKEDRMLLYAQKITPLKDPAKAVGFELLIRMRDEQGRIVAPSDFISAAQRYQLLPTIDRWVLGRALQQLSPFANILLHRGISMSINVSGQSVGDTAFMQSFVEQLGTSGVAPSCITIEITEQTAVSNLPKAVDMVRRLRQLGCRLALDDFGTGTNSLAYLKGFPVTRVKIDGSFIRDILTNARSEQTVQGIVQLAQGMGIDTVAEFVETDAIARKVRSMGIDYAQGYAYGKPEPLADVLKTFEQEDRSGEHRFAFDI